MIEAAVAYADNEGPPPPSLRLKNMIDQYGAAAVLGNDVLDIGMISEMDTLSMVVDAIRWSRKAKGKQIHNMPDSYKETIAYLLKLGISV